ncbi:MAG: methyltransferase domain-containing protein [Ignavibacteriaceae bacterium]|nr:methyltransferase domain-containing protein [Ignavibacteriaceae bacterium]
MNINYKLVSSFIGWEKTESFVQELILKNSLKSILEIGAGANPTINPSFINEHNLNYTISDLDDNELQKADKVYDKLVADFSSVEFNLSKKFDLVFSRMVGEHISNAETFHQNIFKTLNKGGLSFHCFSTLYALPFLVNKISPDQLSDYLLTKIAPRDKHQHGKFKAHYDWCRGPSKKMINRFENIGYEIVEYIGYFGHNYYKKNPLLNKAEKIKSELLKKISTSLL